MTRLNQSRRQLIGYIYCPQVNNDVTIPSAEKSLSGVVEQSFQRNMTGGSYHKKMKKPSNSRVVEQVSKVQFGRGDVPEVIEGSGREVKKIGRGLGISGRSGTAGTGVSLAGTGLNIPGTGNPIGSGVSLGSGIGLAGAGLGLPGRGLNIPGSGKLPGELLKHKILKKLIKDKKMKGDMYMSDGASRTKDVVGSKSYVLKGSGKNKKGGFFPFIIAAIAAAASAASAVAATTVVGSVTVGALAGAALTGAATTAGALAVKKIAGSGKHKKGGALLQTLKPIFVKAAEQAKFTINDFSKEAQEKIVAIGNEVKENPSIANIKKLGEIIAPHAQQLIKEKITEKVTPTLQKVGLTVGSGFKGKGVESNKFNNSFVKVFVTEMKNQV
jgi:hypothetical protein